MSMTLMMQGIAGEELRCGDPIRFSDRDGKLYRWECGDGVYDGRAERDYQPGERVEWKVRF